jgi:hypothetical protein
LNPLLAGITKAAFSLTVFSEDAGPEFAEAKRAQLEAVSVAIEPAARAQKIARPAEWAALVLAIGDSETGFSLRIGRGECKPRECDRGRARGPFQLHRYAEAVDTWEQMHGLEHIGVQVRVASARLQRGYFTCRGAGDWFVSTVNGFAGVRCSQMWGGLEKRAATYRRLVRVIDGEMARIRKEAKS